MVLQSVHVLPSLFSHGMNPQQGFLPPATLLSGCVEPSQAVAAAEMPCWEWVPLGFMQRIKMESFGLCLTIIRQHTH